MVLIPKIILIYSACFFLKCSKCFCSPVCNLLIKHSTLLPLIFILKKITQGSNFILVLKFKPAEFLLSFCFAKFSELYFKTKTWKKKYFFSPRVHFPLSTFKMTQTLSGPVWSLVLMVKWSYWPQMEELSIWLMHFKEHSYIHSL